VIALVTLLFESTRVLVPVGALPVDSHVEIVQLETGWFASREIGETPEEALEFKPPPGVLVVSVFGPNGAARGFTRVASKGGAEMVLQAPATPRRGRGQLSMELTFPKDSKPDPLDVALHLGRDARQIAPDVLVVSGGEPARARAYWFDVPSGPAAIVLASKEWTIAKTPRVDVPERGALALRAEMIPRPSLRLRFDVAEDVGRGLLEVDLLDCEKERNFPGPTPILRCAPTASRKAGSDTEFFFAGLDPDLFAVRWRLGRWTNTLTVDLASAQSIVRTITIRPFEVFGRVTSGGLPAAAKLTFSPENTGLSCDARADEDGNYRIALVRRGWFLVGIDRPGLAEFGSRVELEGDEPRDERIDFDVPVNRVVVRILDAKSGDAIPRATALVEDLQHGANTSSDADDSGLATLAPLKPGAYEVTVSAKGYQTSQPRALDVNDSTGDEEIDIALPKSPGIRLRVLDVRGNPVGDASVFAMDGANVTSGGRTDRDGIVVPTNPLVTGQPLVAWDPAGHIGVARWSGDDQQELVIPPSAPPILIRFVSAEGRPRPDWAPAFAVDGVLVPLYAERSLGSGGDAVSRADGTFRLAGLPTSGISTLWPFGRPEQMVTRPLPVGEEIVFAVPAR
jgi:hypothetical protein